MAETCVKPTFVKEVTAAHVIVAANDDDCDCDDVGNVGLYYDDTGYFDDFYNFVE